MFTSTRAISKRHDYREPLIVRRSAKLPEPARSPLLYRPLNCLEETQLHCRPVEAGLTKIMLQWPLHSSHPSRQTPKAALVAAVSSRVVQGLHLKCAPDSIKYTNSTVTVSASWEQTIIILRLLLIIKMEGLLSKTATNLTHNSNSRSNLGWGRLRKQKVALRLTSRSSSLEASSFSSRESRPLQQPVS